MKELANPEWKRARLDQCTTGLSGPQGGLHLKPTLIRTTDPAMQAPVTISMKLYKEALRLLLPCTLRTWPD